MPLRDRATVQAREANLLGRVFLSIKTEEENKPKFSFNTVNTCKQVVVSVLQRKNKNKKKKRHRLMICFRDEEACEYRWLAHLSASK